MSKYFRQVNKCLIKLRKGDETQLGTLFDLTANHMKVVARHYLANKDNADDVVVEAFLRLKTRTHMFDGKRDGYNWLCKIVQRIALDFNRNRVDKRETAPIEAAEHVVVSAPVDKETKADLQNAMDSLDEESRDIVYLRFYEGYTYDEIGEKYGVGKSAVKRRIDRILEKIKKFLDPM